jgi:hypothetical protein
MSCTNTYILVGLTAKNAVFWDVALNRSVLPPANAGSSLVDFSTLKMEAICSSETSAHTRSARRHISEDGMLQKHPFSCFLELQFGKKLASLQVPRNAYFMGKV